MYERLSPVSNRDGDNVKEPQDRDSYHAPLADRINSAAWDIYQTKLFIDRMIAELEV